MFMVVRVRVERMRSDASDPADGEEGTVRPDDLDISADRRVVELDERRYVVATAGGDAPSPPAEGDADSPEADAATDTDADGPSDRAEARRALVEYVEGRDARHGFVVVGSFDGEVEGAEAFADDIPDVFAEFVTWYAANVDAETPPAEVLGILHLAAGVPVQYPAAALDRLLSVHDLSADDPIDDLLTVARRGGLRFPPAAGE